MYATGPVYFLEWVRAAIPNTTMEQSGTFSEEKDPLLFLDNLLKNTDPITPSAGPERAEHDQFKGHQSYSMCHAPPPRVLHDAVCLAT